jgi:hypothetical protein
MTDIDSETIELLKRRNFLIGKKWDEGLTTFEELELYALEIELEKPAPVSNPGSR